MKGSGRRAEEWMGVKFISIVPKIHMVGCHLDALSGSGGRGSYTWSPPWTAKSIKKHLPAPSPQGRAEQIGRKDGGCSSSMHLLLISFQKTEYWYHSKRTQASELERGSNMAKVLYLYAFFL